MKKEKKNPPAPRDRHLDVPSEANRDKHANFLAWESGDSDPANDNERGKLYERKNKKEPRSGR